MKKMTSSKVYFIRAVYDWLVDNNCTPHLAVDAEANGVQVPAEHIEDGRIVLNISPKACRGLHLENDRIIFSARFGGIATQVFVPPAAVLAIYAKENGKGMVFGDDEEGGGEEGPRLDDAQPPPPGSPPQKPIKGKPRLKIIK